MAVFKCKMCGGALEINNAETVATCEYCGTRQTLPRLDDERKANIYDRANHFRRNNEFDKAMYMYEQILNEDRTDAEAYWSILLCRYGIEYVEDPSSHKRVPTVNRAQFTSIFDDDNYKSALQYADSYQRHIYEEEAKAINEIQKGILAISQNEEPFDVFICYKETDNYGRRTPDSVLANELYHQLIQEGFKVFFSRITLEDKLGTAYEPYIFAALNSAKVMVVLGTKPEYFKAVWVRNEWSRYLALIKQGQKKILIPAYKDMDPYDLPEEFSHLQAQDMSRLGFMQDLIRGIKKIAQPEAPKATVSNENSTSTGNASIAPLIKRAFMFLEDGDFSSANEYCEKVLDMDPENAQAYLGKLMSELHVRKQESLKDLKGPFNHSNNYQKAVRFADELLRNTLIGYINHINTRNENARLYGIYVRAKNMMSAAGTENSFKEAAKLFESINNYENSAELAKECLMKAEAVRKDEILLDAKSKMIGENITYYKMSMKLLSSIPGWRDADSLLSSCENKISEIKAKAETERLERERQAELARKEKEKRAKRNRKIAIATVATICSAVVLVILLTNVIIPFIKYSKAVSLMDAGKYTKAISAFESLDGFIDSNKKIEQCYVGLMDEKYNKAVSLMDEGKYSKAISEFESLDGYMDSNKKIEQCYVGIYGKEGWERIKNTDVGDVYMFGSYEQDNCEANGKEDIEWQVLEKDGTKIFVISKYALDCQPYHQNDEEVNTIITWANCSLREWLNNDFINSAFTDKEKEAILNVTVSADKNPEYTTDPGNDTQDKVFIFSISEVNKYFETDSEKKCEATEYAKAVGVYCYRSDNNCWWWLRSPGSGMRNVAAVNEDGSIYSIGFQMNCNDNAVRPAMWIDLNY